MKETPVCPRCGIEQFTNGSTVSNWRNKGSKENKNGDINKTYQCKECDRNFTIRSQQTPQESEGLEETMENDISEMANDTSEKVKRLEGVLSSHKGWLSRTDVCKKAKVDQGFFEMCPDAAQVYRKYIDEPRLEKLARYLSNQAKKMDPNSFKKLLTNPARICSGAEVGVAWFGECREVQQVIQNYVPEEVEGSQDEHPIDVPLSVDDSLSKEIESLKADHSLQIESIKADHSHRIEELEAEIRRLIAEIQTRPIEVDLNMQATIDTCKGTISNLNEELARSKQENEQLRAKVAGIQQQIDSVKAEYATVIEENRYLKAKKESGVDFDRLISDLMSEVKQKEYLLSAAMELKRSIAGER